MQIQFPEKNSERPDVITIQGLDENTEAARDDILKIVTDLVSQGVRGGRGGGTRQTGAGQGHGGGAGRHPQGRRRRRGGGRVVRGERHADSRQSG